MGLISLESKVSFVVASVQSRGNEQVANHRAAKSDGDDIWRREEPFITSWGVAMQVTMMCQTFVLYEIFNLGKIYIISSEWKNET